MKYLLITIMAITFFACSPRPVHSVAGSSPVYLIGYTGGWGGGPAYKLEGGQLYESIDQHNPGSPEATVNDNTFKPLKSATGLQAMKDIEGRFQETLVSGVSPGFICPEMAYDGVCPYFIIVKDDNIRGWTLSEKETYPTTFKSFMEEVGEALTKM